MDNFGFFKVATAIPDLKVADCEYNLSRIVDMMQRSTGQLLCLCVSAFSCLHLSCAGHFALP